MDIETQAKIEQWWMSHDRREVCAETCAQYVAELNRLVSAGAWPENAPSRAIQHKRRAAIVYGALEIIHRYMAEEPLSEDAVAAAVRLLETYPPGDPDQPPACGSRGRAPRRWDRPHSKDHVTRELERRWRDWRRQFFDGACRYGRRMEALATLMACGPRPVEIEWGVHVYREGAFLRFDGCGAKVNAYRHAGQEIWSVWVLDDPEIPEIAYLSRQVGESVVTVTCPRYALRHAVGYVARTVFPASLAQRVTPYCFRHDFAARLGHLCIEERSLALHHASARNRTDYGRRSRGRGPGPCVMAAGGARPVRAVVRTSAPAAKADWSGPDPRPTFGR